MTQDVVVSLLCEILNSSESFFQGTTPLTLEHDIELIDIAKLMIEIEKRFEITIHDEHVHTFRTINDVVNYVDALISE